VSADLDAVVWPAARAGDALQAAGRAAGLAMRAVKAPEPPPEGDEATGRWFAASGDWLGIETEEIVTRHSDLARTLTRAAPAVVGLPAGGYVVLARGGRRGTLRALAPDGTPRALRLEALRARLAHADEDGIAGFVDQLLEAAGVPPRRRARSAAALCAQRLASREYARIWLVRATPGSGFLRQAWAAGLARVAAALLSAHALLYALMLGAWALLGRGVLGGNFDAGWLVGWALLLLTTIPLRQLVIWCEGRVALEFGQLLKQRLLQGALNFDPEVMRRSGSGELLARVLESESVEGLTITGGVSAGLAVVEVAFVLFVLSQGAGGVAQAGLFALWVGVAAAGTARLFTRRRAWITERLRNTHELVERMLGHRTRLAQEAPEQWHAGEDGLLETYLARSRAMDRTAIAVDALVGRGWLVIGLLALIPAVLGGEVTEPLAVAVGGVLLGDRALRRFSAGLAGIADATLAWRVVGPLFDAAPNVVAPGVPGLLETGARTARAGALVLEASDLTFQHAGRGEPVLRGCSLAIARGDRILLEGASGSGKSTLAAVLTGLRVPQSGLLLLHGLDPASVGGPAWRRSIACAPQFHENHVLTGSFAFNLLLADRWPGSDEDLAEAEAICRELGLGPLLDRMPAGMLQVVGETGWQLSHGERSRMFLARALLQRADVVVLDESFAALDPENLDRALRCAAARSPSLMVIAHP
jgi:ATP-binding cassette, subfamily B, bacterial